MAQYLMVYFGGDKPSTPEEGKAHFAAYQAWLSGLGEAVVSPMNPVKETVTLSAEGVSSGSSTAMSGYTILQADSKEAAMEMARACPFLDINGTLEVSELVQMG